ncbi:VOC family protein [Pseudoroseomonas globiformis]|uniref:VOC family protein n=1 Tax=Teichococcus globiformis TaxID=2307229 RepID=A0ABV7G644_9PROT
MIAYTMVGTRDLGRARRFYDPLFETMGQEPCYSDGQVASWGRPSDPGLPRFFAGYPSDGQPAGTGNGGMTAFLVPDAATIDRLHALALQNGGSSEGAPGHRPQYSEGFYAAYVRDPDGNKLAFISYDGRR